MLYTWLFAENTAVEDDKDDTQQEATEQQTKDATDDGM